MTQITINNRKIEKEISSAKSINAAMDFILSDIASEQEVVSDISINGKSISLEQEETVLNQPLSNYDSVDFTLRSSLDLAFDALDSCNAYIDLVIDKIHTLTGLYQENKIDEANAKFGEAIEIIDLFVQLVSRIYRTLKSEQDGNITKSDTIQNLEIHLLSIMKAMVPAKEKEDIIMLCDLLEYELVDNLTQWKIKAIPELKKHKNI